MVNSMTRLALLLATQAHATAVVNVRVPVTVGTFGIAQPRHILSNNNPWKAPVVAEKKDKLSARGQSVYGYKRQRNK